MKEITIRKYQAIDGTNFDSENECREYEASNADCIIRGLPYYFMQAIDIYNPLAEWDSSEYLLGILPKTEKELKAICDWFSVYTYDFLTLDSSHCNKVLLFLVSISSDATWYPNDRIGIKDVEGVTGYLGTVEEHLLHISKSLCKINEGVLNRG